MLSLLDWNRARNTPKEIIVLLYLRNSYEVGLLFWLTDRQVKWRVVPVQARFQSRRSHNLCNNHNYLSCLLQRSPFRSRSASQYVHCLLKYRDSLLYSQHRGKSVALFKTSCRPKPVYTVSYCSILTIFPAGYSFSVQYIHHYPPYLEVVFSVCNLRALHAGILKD
jgi:hypothetical protein